MASDRLGMDPEQVAQRANAIRGRTMHLGSISDEIAQTGQASRWPGMFGLIPGNVVMTQGSIWLAESAAADIRAAVASADVLVARLLGEVQDQRDTSSATDGYHDGVSRAQLDRKVAEAMADPSVLDQMSPEQIASWWSRLSPEQANKLWSGHPRYFGNRDGVPYDVRISANRLNAIDDLATDSISSDEHRAYLEGVRDGDFHLVTYDPENDRLVEAIGLGEFDEEQGRFVYFDEPPTEVVTYVPGTMTNNESVYGKGADEGAGLREVPEWLHQDLQERGERAVVFIYKDGRFPGGTDGDLLPFGLAEANDAGLAARSGETLARFQENLGRESYFSGADTAAVGHSWGFANISNSEGSGARYDTVISIAGAAAPDDWSAQSGTDYSHHSYIDALAVAHDAGWVAGQDPDSLFGAGNTHLYAAPDNYDLVGNHSLSNSTVNESGRPENQRLLGAVTKEIVQ